MMNFKSAKRNKKFDVWLSIFFLSLLFLGLNYYIGKIDLIIDASSKSKHTVSFETTARLNKLTSSVNIFITIPNKNSQPKIIQKLLHDFEITVKSFMNLNLNHEINIYKLNLDTIRKTSEVLIKNKITERNSIIVTSENGNKKIIFSYKPTNKQYQYDPSISYRSDNSLAREAVWESGFYDNWKESVNNVLVPTSYKGEELLLKTILDVASPKPTRNVAYFTRGHGESSPSDVNPDSGYSEFRTMLEDRNTVVSSIDLGTIERMPSNAKLLIIANPKGIFQDQEVSIIRNFVNNEQGSLLVTIDPNEEISVIDKPAYGLRETLKEWGIRCHDILIYDPDDRNFDIFSGDYSIRTYSKSFKHNITKSLKAGEYSIQAEKVRPVESIKSPSNEFISNELLFSSKTSWGVTSWANRTFPPTKNKLLDVDGPLPVLCVAEDQNNELSNSGKIGVLGAASILSNKKLKNNTGNRILASNLIYWLTENENIIGIPVKNKPLYKFTLSKFEFEKLIFTLAIVPICIAITGGFVSWLRKDL
jgi:hypothetical protein